MRVLITGANRGIGYAMAAALLARGDQVLMTSRDESRGQEARQRLLTERPGSELELSPADLSSPGSIDRLVDELLDRARLFDAVIHNAGMLMSPPRRELTAEGVEVTLATNALGPLRLTEGLAPLLTCDARVLGLTSRLHLPGSRGEEVDFSFDDPQVDHDYSQDRAYKNSKLALIWVCRELDRRLPARTTVNAICPGFAPETAAQYATGRTRFLLQHVVPRLPFSVTVPEAAANVLWALGEPELSGRGGLYLADRGIAEASPAACDAERAVRFCELAHTWWPVREPRP